MEIKRSGYIYSPGTAAGFLKMQRQGIPRPIFRVEDKLRKLLRDKYGRIIAKLLKDFKRQVSIAGLKIRDDLLTVDEKSEDTLNELLEFFEEMGRQEAAAKSAEENAQLRASVSSVSANLNSEWEQTEFQVDEEFQNQVGDVLIENQIDYTQRLQDDASEALKHILNNFSIDKQKLYNENMEALRKLYLDNSIERIKYEENWLKKQFLQRLNDYAVGKVEKLDLEDLTEGLLHDGSRMSQFFARDQLARFNKATTLATFQSAGVTKVKWVTTHDVRVRLSHKALDGQIFDVNALPPEVDDYNCRCGLVPVEYSE